MENFESEKIEHAEILAIPYHTEWRIENSVSEVGKSSARFQELLENLHWEGDAIDAAGAFSELMINAVVHGNLHLQKEAFKKELKEKLGSSYNDLTADEEFYKEIDRVGQLPDYKNKKTTVTIEVPTSRKLIFSIQDNGKDTEITWENGKVNKESLEHPTEYTSNRGFTALNYFLKSLKAIKKSEKNEIGVKVTVDSDLDRNLEDHNES